MKIRMLACAALFSVMAATAAQAQYAGVPYGAPYAPAPLAPGGAMMSMPPMAYDPSVMPAGYAGASCDDAGGAAPGGGLLAGWGLGAGCNGACGGTCGGACGGDGCGCGSQGLLAGCLGDCWNKLHSLCGGCGGMCESCGPDGTGACCNPRYFDIQAEWLYWQREDAGDTLNLASDGVLGPIVLSTDQLSLDEQSGFRVTGSYLVGPGATIEGTYFGTFNWSDSAVATSANNNLYSVYSNFGFNPIGGFPETDAASQARIAYSSALDNGEINVRRRWTSANCLFHGSYLGGVRYVSLVEDFEYQTLTNVASLNSLTSTDNDLIGLQLGGELLMCVTSRLKVGAEAEGGLYGIKARQTTTITTSTQVFVDERAHDEDVAFVGEAGAIALFRLTDRCTLRGGYQVFYLDGVALATENFNTASPFSIRNTVMNDNGSVFYHGAAGGFEWTW